MSCNKVNNILETITKENSVESKYVHYGDSNVVNKFN